MTADPRPPLVKICPACREAVHADATRCRYCQSSLAAPAAEPKDDGTVKYILDKGLITYVKTAIGVASILIGAGAFFFGLNLWTGAKEVSDIKKDVQESVEDVKKAIVDIDANSKKVAEAAREAQTLLDRISIIEAESKKKVSQQDLDTAIRNLVEKPGPADPVALHHPDPALQKILDDALPHLDAFFGVQSPADRPVIKLVPPTIENLSSVYIRIDTGELVAPPQAVNFPDVIYRNAAYAYLGKVFPALYNASGEGAAIEVASADIIAELTDQKLRSLTAITADWELYRGYGEWLQPNSKADAFVLSLRNPPIDHVRYLRQNVTQQGPPQELDDNFYRYKASSLPLKPFYLMATDPELDSDGAWELWRKGLANLTANNLTFEALASSTLRAAGADAKKTAAVRKAWQAVGLLDFDDRKKSRD